MIRFRRFMSDYFTFNRSERAGIRFLLVIILFLLSAIIAVPYIIPEQQADYTEFDAKVRDFLATADTLPQKKPYEKKYYTSQHYKKQYRQKQLPVIRRFDPNGLPAEQWVQMGLSEKQAQVVKRYELKNGPFRQKEDLKKIFVISEDFYARIAPFVMFEPLVITDSAQTKTTTAPVYLDLNTATREQLMEVKGIGEVLADNILAYKDRLGGYCRVEQLMEVKYMREENYQAVKSCFYTDNATQELRRININYASFKEIVRHPYLDYDQTAKIVEYRRKQGHFKDVKELQTRGLVDEQLYIKLVPYITVK